MKSYVNGLILSFQFFTSLPLAIEVSMNKKNIERSIRLFPILGLFFGFFYSISANLLQNYSPLSNRLIAFFICLLTIGLTGGIHIDGWMDTADAFFSYREKEKRLEIMSDPRVGAFGVIGGFVLLFAKYLFIYELLVQSNPHTYLYIIFLPILSRSLMAFVLLLIPNAKEKGLGYLFQDSREKFTLSFYFIYFFISLMVLFISWKFFLNLLTLLIVTIFSFYFVKNKSLKWFGGMTGDLVGAATEGGELILWGVLLLLHYFGMV